MNQEEINQREWKDPDNWGKRFGFYHSSADNRLWVRKPEPWMGWSLNMAKPLAWVMVGLFTLLLCLLVAWVVFLVVPR